MKRTSFENVRCPVAQSLERLGDAWSMLIIRDALNGLKRFDEFEKNLKIAPNMLTRRLNSLVEAGLFERLQYSQRPPRFEYILTESGRDFQSVIHAMLAFGNRHFSRADKAVVLVDTETGLEADPVMVDSVSGAQISHPRFKTSAEIDCEALSQQGS